MKSFNPPQDGTIIFACGNISYEVPANEDDIHSPIIGGGVEPFDWAMFWDAAVGDWLWASNRMSVRTCFSDQIHFHWWTEWSQPQPAVEDWEMQLRRSVRARVLTSRWLRVHANVFDATLSFERRTRILRLLDRIAREHDRVTPWGNFILKEAA